MAEEMRILDLPTRRELDKEDYFAVDRPGGTNRVPATVVQEYARQAAEGALTGTDVKKYLTNCITGTEDGVIRFVPGTKANYTIVGTPNLSDGVLTGGTATDYVTVSAGPKTVQKSLFVQAKIHTPAAHGTAVGRIFGGRSESGGFGFALDIDSGIVRVYLSSNGTTWNLASNASTNKVLPTDADVWLRLTWDGTCYAFSWSSDGEKFTTGWVLASRAGINFGSAGVLQIGQPYPGACDLNGYALNIDGEFVYNGGNFYKCNGTASEGGPAINAGKISGFAGNKYFLLPQKAKQAIKSLDVTVKWTTAATLSTWQNIISLVSQYGIVAHTHANGHIYLWVGAGAAWDVREFDTQLVCEAGKTYWLKIVWNGDTVTPMLSEDGVSFVAGRCFEKHTAIGWNNVVLGCECIGGGNIQQGSFDLAGCVMRVDGDIVFDGANVVSGGATLENGVLSGFAKYKTASTDKFVPVSQDHYIYQVKMHTPASWAGKTHHFFLGCVQRPDGYQGGLLAEVNNAGKIIIYNDTASYTAKWNIMEAYEQRSDQLGWILPTDADVWFRLVRVAKLGYLPQISFDGVNFKSGRFLPSAAATGAQLKYFSGVAYGTDDFWLGTIDLKETFFKNDGEYVFKGANLITVNEAQIANGSVSGALATVYSGAFYPMRTEAASAENWDILFNFTTTEHTNRVQDIVGNFINNYPKVYLQNSKLYFFPDNAARITTPSGAELLPGAKYWARVTWDGAKYALYHLADDGEHTKDALPELTEWVKDGEWASATDWYKDIMFNFCHSRQYPAETFTGTVHLDGCRFVRNGITFWEWNGKNGDNFDLNHKTGWTYNGGDYANIGLKNEPSWIWNGKDDPNTAMDGGKVWKLVKEFPGAIYEKAGVRALVRQGVNADGSVKNLSHVCQQDTAVPLPEVQEGAFTAYVDGAGDVRVMEKAQFDTATPLPGVRLADFAMQEYILTTVKSAEPLLLESARAAARKILYAAGPDFSAYISLSNGEFSAPEEGWIFAYKGGGDYANCQLSVNGVIFQNTTSGSFNSGSSMAFRISKGQTVHLVADNGSIKFVPLLPVPDNDY